MVLPRLCCALSGCVTSTQPGTLRLVQISSRYVNKIEASEGTTRVNVALCTNTLSLSTLVDKYTTIISAYARNGDHTRAEELLNVMIDDFLNGNKRAKPDSQLFDTVISACTGGRTNCPTSIIKAADAFRAESVLRRMWSLHETGQLVGVRPQGTTYKYVIIGYKKSGNPCRAEELLWEMERKSVAKAHKQLFQTVLNAWHESHHHDKQRKLNTLRLVMNDRFGPKSNSGNGKYGSSKRYQ